MPSFVTFWPVLPSVTAGTFSSGAAARSRSAAARAAPVAAAVRRNRRRLPPPQDPCAPSIVLIPWGRIKRPGARPRGAARGGLILTSRKEIGQQPIRTDGDDA